MCGSLKSALKDWEQIKEVSDLLAYASCSHELKH